MREFVFGRLWLVLLVCVALVLPAWGRGPRIPEVPLSKLPPEAATTLELIKRGGPFPYRRDGLVFQNREGRLPAKQTGYYREYTVPTPGSKDRGARRIVAGAEAEYYYTADHYRSFRRIRE